jgi:hypothetical protein
MNDEPVITAKPTVHHREKEYIVELSIYPNSHRKCLKLLDSFGTAQFIATLNVGDLSPTQVCIKNWSENNRIAFALRKYLEGTGEFVPVGSQRAYIYELVGPLRDPSAAPVREEESRDPYPTENRPGCDDGIEIDLPTENIAYEEGSDSTSEGEPQEEDERILK